MHRLQTEAVLCSFPWDVHDWSAGDKGVSRLWAQKKYLGEVARTRLGSVPHIGRGCSRSERHRAQKMEGGSKFAPLMDENTAYVEGGQGGVLTADSSQYLPGPPGPPPSTTSHTQGSAQGASRLSWLPGQPPHVGSSPAARTPDGPANTSESKDGDRAIERKCPTLHCRLLGD